MSEKRPKFIEVFPWNSNFETGIADVDAQHRRLVELLNQLAGHLGNRSDPVELNQVFADLAAYADYHFKTEEGVWEPHFGDDAWYQGHKKVHESFIADVVALKEEEKTKPLETVVEDILKFLTHWLAFHILDSDKRMAKAVHAIESGKTLEAAKKQADEEMSGSMQVLIDTVLSMYDDLSSRTLELMREQAERKRIEIALRESNQRDKIFSDAFIKSVPGLLYLYDRETLKLVRWNNKLEEVSGYSAEELAEKRVPDFFEEALHEDVLAAVAAPNESSPAEVELPLLTRNGETIPYYFNSMVIDIDGREYIAGTGIDITDITRTRSELIKAKDDLKASLTGTISAVAKAVEARDPYTAGHQQRVAQLAQAIAQQMRLDSERIEGLRMGASIHDIGKLYVPAELLTKPTRLTEIEYQLIQSHAEVGYKILKDIEFPWPIAEIAHQHHERFDGSGYPQGIKGEKICLEARIAAVADVVEAIASHRPYRPGRGIDIALEEIRSGQGKLYDPDVVDACLEIFETGSFSFD